MFSAWVGHADVLGAGWECRSGNRGFGEKRYIDLFVSGTQHKIPELRTWMIFKVKDIQTAKALNASTSAKPFGPPTVERRWRRSGFAPPAPGSLLRAVRDIGDRSEFINRRIETTRQ